MNLSGLSLWMAQATGRPPSRGSKRKDFMIAGTALHPCIALKRPSLYRSIHLVYPSRNTATTSSFCTFQERSTLHSFFTAAVKRTNKAAKALIVRSVLASEQVDGIHTNHESFPPSVLPELQGYGPMETGVPALVVFSGGTAFNSVAGHVRQLTTRVTHVLPVSDDGGSTAEIVRVLGGPAVGDIRSRCLRLADDSDAEAQAVRKLLAYRLPSQCATEAKKEWYDIVEGDHELWQVSIV
jgi:hypothetical protein